MTDSWPGMMRTVYGDHDRFITHLFHHLPGQVFHRRRARRDGDGYYWINRPGGDVINVSGHRLGNRGDRVRPGQPPAVAEAAVVGYPHDIKGQASIAS